MIQILLTLFSAFSFLVYGITCLSTAHMRREFARYGLAKWRTLTGGLQLTGAFGLVVGFRVPEVGCLAAGGLAALMILGFLVRLRIRDGWLRASPALFYFLLNAVLAFSCLRGA